MLYFNLIALSKPQASNLFEVRGGGAEVAECPRGEHPVGMVPENVVARSGNFGRGLQSDGKIAGKIMPLAPVSHPMKPGKHFF